jgi:signal peptidase I
MTKLIDPDYGYSVDDSKFKPGGLLVEALHTLVFALSLSIVIYLFFAIPNQVQGSSMYPFLKEDEVLLTNKFIQITGGDDHIIEDYNYKRGDLVVFQLPDQPDLVKRVIGLPGETVKIRDGRVIVNGEVLVEDYLPAGRRTQAGPFIPENTPKTVPSDSYFVLGDNRSNSRDSRTIEVGFIQREYIKGSPFLRVYPLEEFGLLSPGTIDTIPEKEVFGTNTFRN